MNSTFKSTLPPPNQVKGRGSRRYLEDYAKAKMDKAIPPDAKFIKQPGTKR
ncbi:hypothetical protein L195_g055439, partial [Trifolium pratense]